MEISDRPNLSSDTDQSADKNSDSESSNALPADEPVVDVSEKSWDIISPPLVDRSDGGAAVEALYIYNNVFNLIPRSIGRLGHLKTLKFFANDIDIFPSDTGGELAELERLQVKVASPSLLGLPLQRLRALKELELCLVPPRPSAFSLLGDVSSLKCLTKLSVCHYSIRYLPPEIRCLEKLEDLDLSFNKLKSLPNDIVTLSSLKSLRVANNKLVELPSNLSCLQRLENLDLSNNRLTSLKSLRLDSMSTLRNLNLQYNKLRTGCQIPSWIRCNLEGNGEDGSHDDSDSLVKEIACDSSICGKDSSRSCKACHSISSSTLSAVSSNSRGSGADRMRKGWKRRDFLQQRACQERLNTSRKWKVEDHHEITIQKMAAKCSPCKRTHAGSRSSKLHCQINEKKQACNLPRSSSFVEKTSGAAEELERGQECNKPSDYESLLAHSLDDSNNLLNYYYEKDCSSIVTDSGGLSEEHVCECDVASSPCCLNKIDEHDEDSSSEASKTVPTSKRHSDSDLDNPKPRKYRRPFDISNNLSLTYNTQSFCGSNEHLPDGFYDAGRDRPFMPLQHYEQNLSLDSREVILVDREKDEELDAIVLTAQILDSSFTRSRCSGEDGEQFTIDNLQRASLLALFVSDCFGGSDRSNCVVRMRKGVAGLNYERPFVCTCATGNTSDDKISYKEVHRIVEHSSFNELCERFIRYIKETRKSNIVPIGTLRFGVCRHRAVLMKYLCDRVDPPIPCELVRGYLDFRPHAWNNILVRRGDSLVRMVVDACHPADIREETDSEYFCRYIPLICVNVPVATEDSVAPECLFPSLPSNDVQNTKSGSIVQCKFGTHVAAAKLRTLEVSGASEELRNFEFKLLGEVRILRALEKHKCIVEIYGHQLSSKWIPEKEGIKEHRLLQSAIVMEYIKDGSLKCYIEKLAKNGMKHVPVKLAMFIARDVACALVEVHSKHIIHRDIKSENILVDLASRRADGSPVVKMCDFDMAVPLHSLVHTCCIAHLGTHPPNVCAGTPRWMAPEVLRAMHSRHQYGLEVDIWSYGCVLLELLTLEVPYGGMLDSEFHHLLQMNQRPPLPDKLEALVLSDQPSMVGSDSSLTVASESDAVMLRTLIDLFYQCTDGNPAKRPSAIDVYEILSSAMPSADSAS